MGQSPNAFSLQKQEEHTSKMEAGIVWAKSRFYFYNKQSLWYHSIYFRRFYSEKEEQKKKHRLGSSITPTVSWGELVPTSRTDKSFSVCAVKVPLVSHHILNYSLSEAWGLTFSCIKTRTMFSWIPLRASLGIYGIVSHFIIFAYVYKHTCIHSKPDSPSGIFSAENLSCGTLFHLSRNCWAFQKLCNIKMKLRTFVAWSLSLE